MSVSDKKNHTNLFLSLLLFIFALFLTIPNAAVTPQNTDGAEYATAAVTNALVHQPGYPWYMQISRILVNIFDSNPYFTLAAFSALCHSLSVLVLYFLAIRLSKSYTLSFVVSLSWLVFQPALQVATDAEVFALHHLISVLVLLLTLGLFYCDKIKNAWFLGILMGLGGAHHQVLIFFLPFVFSAVIYRKYFCSFIFGGLIGLSAYLLLFLPESALVYPQMTTFGELLKHVLRDDYGTFNLHADSDISQVSYLPHFLKFTFNTIPLYLLATIFLMFIALIKRKLIFVGVLLSNLAFLWFAYNLKMPEISTIYTEIIIRFYGSLGLLLIINFLLIYKAYEKKKFSLPLALLILIPVAISVPKSLGSSEASSDRTINHELEAILKIPQNQVFISSLDRIGMGLYYKQLVEKKRQDIILIHGPLLTGKRYQSYLKTRYPELQLQDFNIEALVKHFFDRGKQIYTYHETAKPDSVQLFPIGVVWQWLPKDVDIPEQLIARNLFSFCSRWPENLQSVNSHRENSKHIMEYIYLKPFEFGLHTITDQKVLDAIQKVAASFYAKQISDAKKFCNTFLSESLSKTK